MMTLTFNPDVLELFAPVQTTDDPVAETIENLIGRLSAVVGGQQRVNLGVTEATATIDDNDGKTLLLEYRIADLFSYGPNFSVFLVFRALIRKF